MQVTYVSSICTTLEHATKKRTPTLYILLVRLAIFFYQSGNRALHEVGGPIGAGDRGMGK